MDKHCKIPGITVEFTTEEVETRLGITKEWFRLHIPGYECTDIYIALSKNTGEWLSASKTFFSLAENVRTLALQEARRLLETMCEATVTA